MFSEPLNYQDARHEEATRQKQELDRDDRRAIRQRASAPDAAEIMKASALQDARVKRWEGWTWKDYQATIVRQNYKIGELLAAAENALAFIDDGEGGESEAKQLRAAIGKEQS